MRTTVLARVQVAWERTAQVVIHQLNPVGIGDRTSTSSVVSYEDYGDEMEQTFRIVLSSAARSSQG